MGKNRLHVNAFPVSPCPPPARNALACEAGGAMAPMAGSTLLSDRRVGFAFMGRGQTETGKAPSVFDGKAIRKKSRPSKPFYRFPP